MATLTSYGPLLGGLRTGSSDRLWDRPVRKTGTPEEPTALPFGTRAPPLRKELPEDLLNDRNTAAKGREAPTRAAGREPAVRDSDVSFLLDFNAPFLRAVSQVQSPSDVLFREKAVYWDLAPARAAYGKLLYRQNSFFVNRKQDAGLGVNLNSFW